MAIGKNVQICIEYTRILGDGVRVFIVSGNLIKLHFWLLRIFFFFFLPLNCYGFILIKRDQIIILNKHFFFFIRTNIYIIRYF